LGKLQYPYVDSGSVPEPWSGWWWPWYDGGPSGGPYMWQGGNLGGDSGPIYDLDTRYFWRPGPSRWLGQEWEYAMHRRTDPNDSWWGHCWGASCAQALEAYPPTDCGALSRDDLEGLLSELYEDCVAADLTSPDNPIKSGTMWWALQQCMYPGVSLMGVMVVDFSTLVVGGDSVVWNWPVYGYRVDYSLSGSNLDLATGVMTLYYEDHEFNTVNAPDSAKYEFRCKMDGVHTPRRWTGSWDSILRAPGDTPTPPDKACRPVERQIYVQQNSNPWVFAESTDIRRVIDHRTVILDDEYRMTSVPEIPNWPWVQRPGYAGGCWASPCADYYEWMGWHYRLGRDGIWNTYVYKTPIAQGDVPNTDAVLMISVYPYNYNFDQSVPPVDVWVPLGDPYPASAGTYTAWLTNWSAEPSNCMTYFDAVKFEHIDDYYDGGMNASAVVLGHGVQCVRVMPNPVRSTASISYVVPSIGRVEVVVYDVMGRAVLRAPQDVERAGPQNATISLDGLPAGAYIARVNVGGEHSTCRFVVCR